MLTVLSSAPSRKALLSAVPLSDAAKKTKLDNDKTIKDIVGGKDNRKLVVCGPCSADNPEAIASDSKALPTKSKTSCF